jgi:hypothetical protein
MGEVRARSRGKLQRKQKTTVCSHEDKTKPKSEISKMLDQNGNLGLKEEEGNECLVIVRYIMTDELRHNSADKGYDQSAPSPLRVEAPCSWW